MLFGNQLECLFEGVGAVDAWSADLGPRFYDGLADSLSHFIDFQASRTCLLTVLRDTPSRRATKLTLTPVSL